MQKKLNSRSEPFKSWNNESIIFVLSGWGRSDRDSRSVGNSAPPPSWGGGHWVIKMWQSITSSHTHWHTHTTHWQTHTTHTNTHTQTTQAGRSIPCGHTHPHKHTHIPHTQTHTHKPHKQVEASPGVCVCEDVLAHRGPSTCLCRVCYLVIDFLFVIVFVFLFI